MKSFKDLRQLTEKKSLKKACWDGYEAIGMKNKDGRQVPNCVPIKESKEDMACNKPTRSSKAGKKRVSRCLAVTRRRRVSDHSRATTRRQGVKPTRK